MQEKELYFNLSLKLQFSTEAPNSLRSTNLLNMMNLNAAPIDFVSTNRFEICYTFSVFKSLVYPLLVSLNSLFNIVPGSSMKNINKLFHHFPYLNC